MSRSSLALALAAVLLSACSPAAYRVNPPTSQQEFPPPESQEEGNMRILGDLRWDQFTSKEEWMKRFSKCLSQEGDYLVNYNFTTPSLMCSGFIVGGVSVSPSLVVFAQNTGTTSKTMTSEVFFQFLDESKSRAFKSAIAQKYAPTTSGYCSKFTCWDLGDVNEAGGITAKPTPYTISLLDNVKVDKSDI